MLSKVKIYRESFHSLVNQGNQIGERNKSEFMLQRNNITQTELYVGAVI